jgi:CBS domain-containing protein
MNEEKTFKEEIKVSGQQLVETVKKLVHEGNVRRLIIKNEKGETLIEIPVTVATVGAILLPIIAALGAIATLATNCTVEVIKVK